MGNFHLTLLKKKKANKFMLTIMHASSVGCTAPFQESRQHLLWRMVWWRAFCLLKRLFCQWFLFCFVKSETLPSAHARSLLVLVPVCVTDCGTNGLFALRAAVCPYGTWEMSNHHTGCNQLKCRCKFNEKLWEEVLLYTDLHVRLADFVALLSMMLYRASKRQDVSSLAEVCATQILF